MGGFLSQPLELIRVQRGGSAAFRYAAAEMQGWRAGHEDSHAAAYDASIGSFWVLDGHSGAGAAQFAAPRFAQELKAACSPGGSLLRDSQINEVFTSVDSRFKDFVRTNPQEDSGSTVVGAMISKKLDGNYAVKLVNCGDSRAVLARSPSEDEQAAAAVHVGLPRHLVALNEATEKKSELSWPWPVIAESVDHKPNHPTEKARIEAAGGSVTLEDPARLDGNLAVSRGVGDFEYKLDESLSVEEQKVSCIPDVYEISSVKPGSICILACDGIWDVMNGQEVAQFVRDKLIEDAKSELGDIAGELLKSCLGKGSRDNMSVMLIQFADGSDIPEKFPSDEMKNGEKLLDITDDEVLKQSKVFLAREQAFEHTQTAGSCAVCKRWVAKPYQCQCKIVGYCSKPCQKKGWKAHREVCPMVTKGGKGGDLAEQPNLTDE